MTEATRDERDLPECYYMLENNSIRLSDPCVAKAADDVAVLLRRLAAIERQVLWRTEDMPVWGGLWVKDEMRRCYWWGVFCHTFCAAPDYRPDEPGPCFLPILDPPEGS